MQITATASIATEETDREIRQREMQKGREARLNDRPITDCPWNGGLTEKWWKEGYEGQLSGPIVAQ